MPRIEIKEKTQHPGKIKHQSGSADDFTAHQDPKEEFRYRDSIALGHTGGRKAKTKNVTKLRETGCVHSNYHKFFFKKR